MSSDVKNVPYESFRGYEYVVIFLDHYGRLGICYFMRRKTSFEFCCAELAYNGYRVQLFHSDRGSEYFSQDGKLIAVKCRSLGELDKFCVSLSPKD